MKKRHLIVVEWEDPYSNAKWHKEDDLSDIDALICVTVGWEMPSPKGYLSLASSRDAFGKCSDRMVIPRKNVRHIRRLE